MFARQRCTNSAYKSRMSAVGGPSVICNISFPPCAFSVNLETKTHNVLLLGPPNAYRIARSGKRAGQVRQKTLDGVWISKSSLPTKRCFHIERHYKHWCLEHLLIQHIYLYLNFQDNISMKNHFSLRGHHMVRPLASSRTTERLSLGLREKPAMRNTPCQKRWLKQRMRKCNDILSIATVEVQWTTWWSYTLCRYFNRNDEHDVAGTRNVSIIVNEVCKQIQMNTKNFNVKQFRFAVSLHVSVMVTIIRRSVWNTI
jgi:hypothetical protein